MIGSWKLNKESVEVIKDLLELGMTHQSISQMFNVSREHITKIANGQRWNKEQRSFIMKDDMEPVRSNDYRDFGPQSPAKVEVIQSDKDALSMDQKYYLVKFIESLTGKKIKKMVIEF